MPSKSANVKNEKHEALKDKGMSKERCRQDRQLAGRVQPPRPQERLGGNAKQGGTTAQHKAAGRKGGEAAAKKS